MAARIRIVVAEQGTDDDLGAAGIARDLRDPGVEVVFTGGHLTAEQITRTAVQEDADAVGVPGASEPFLQRMRELLADHDADDVLVFSGGAGSSQDVLDRVRQNVAGADTADTG